MSRTNIPILTKEKVTAESHTGIFTAGYEESDLVE